MLDLSSDKNLNQFKRVNLKLSRINILINFSMKFIKRLRGSDEVRRSNALN